MAEFKIEEKNYYTNGGKININMLDRISNGTTESINNINKLLYTSGVLFLPSNISQNFMITGQSSGGTNVTITVGSIGSTATSAYGGVAIDKDGQFIVISKNETYVGCTDTALKYNSATLSWASPVRITDPNLGTTDGQGPTGAYYRSSGNVNIPLYIDSTLTTAENTNYVYIKFVQTVEQTSSSSQSITSGLTTYDSETMYKGGYAIRVINPNVAASLTQDGLAANNFYTVLQELGYIKLGEVYVTVTNSDWTVSSTSINQNLPTPLTTQYAYFNGSMVGAQFKGITGLIDYPTAVNSYVDLFTHINALGTGDVSSKNPHGLSAADIGININNSNVHGVDTIIPTQGCIYTYANPLLNLAENDVVAVAYDTILVDTSSVTNESALTVRLPEANVSRASYRYTIKRIDNASTNIVSLTTSGTTGRTSNLIEGISTDTEGYSVLTLGLLGSTNSCVDVCVGKNASNEYNWYII